MPLPWIKLYCEILEDPKMGKMPEWLFGRCIKLFLMAGREGKDGMLPPVEDIAWSLRLDEDKTAQTLRDLAEVGVTHRADNGSWWIVNFSKRQKLSDSTERVRRFREKEKEKKDRNGNVTVTLPSSSSLPLNSESLSEREGMGGGITAPISPVETAIARAAFNDFDQSSKCEKLYQQITGLPSIPSDNMDRVLHDLPIVIDHYGVEDWDQTVHAGKIIFAKWCNTRGKNNRNYSPTNPGWIGKWIEELAQRPANPDQSSSQSIMDRIRRDMMKAKQ